MAVTLEHNKATGRAPDGKGVVGIYPTPRWSDELYDEPDEQVAELFIDEVEPLVPGLGEIAEFSHVARVAPAVMNSRPGYWTAMREFRRISAERDRRVQLAGDYFCTSSVDAASASGERAARALLAALGGGGAPAGADGSAFGPATGLR